MSYIFEKPFSAARRFVKKHSAIDHLRALQQTLAITWREMTSDLLSWQKEIVASLRGEAPSDVGKISYFTEKDARLKSVITKQLEGLGPKDVVMHCWGAFTFIDEESHKHLPNFSEAERRSAIYIASRAMTSNLNNAMLPDTFGANVDQEAAILRNVNHVNFWKSFTPDEAALMHYALKDMSDYWQGAEPKNEELFPVTHILTYISKIEEAHPQVASLIVQARRPEPESQ